MLEITIFQGSGPEKTQLQGIPSTTLFRMSLYLLEGPLCLTELIYKESELLPEEEMPIKHLSHLFEISFHFKLVFMLLSFYC